jgi:hypothetical protein
MSKNRPLPKLPPTSNRLSRITLAARPRDGTSHHTNKPERPRVAEVITSAGKLTNGKFEARIRILMAYYTMIQGIECENTLNWSGFLPHVLKCQRNRF